ncbi:DUF4921 family protein [Neoactinobaculum massilliense]|uniref:DUF4921 family protein n=1 Tax=Neoactinobaculum massilliense TaxID=2364794 RepID=UPI001F14FECB|nr:DUF4921 family protein [Neoactinobaculum massilliense]
MDPRIAQPLTTLADGTIKQINPFSGTEVWTVPGRADRPIELEDEHVLTLDTREDGSPRQDYCAFCADRVLETPPEKARVVGNPDTGAYRIRQDTPVDNLADPWDFRRIGNLFEILPYSYWTTNYGYQMPHAKRARMDQYVADPAGRAHVLSVLRNKARAAHITREQWDAEDEHAHLEDAAPFFGGGHDVIVARRHYVDGATNSAQRASSGTLTSNEHYWYFALTVDAMHDLYESNRYVRYVQVFQNWLKPAGASFGHLHKQLVAIDEWSGDARSEVLRLRENPNLYNEFGPNYASYQNLVVAENEHAVAFAGFGHRYPTLEVWSRSEATQPWEHTPAELRDVSDLVHAMHAATGPAVPVNEEWYSRPIDQTEPAPWRVLLKWRVSTLAGFEGGTKIYVNTIDPGGVRDRVVPRLLELRAEGKLASGINIGTECTNRLNSLRYVDAPQ